MNELTPKEFKNIFEENFTPVRNYVFYRCGNPDMATDIAQECFVKVWEKRRSLELSNVRALLFKMANDLFIHQYRKDKLAFTFFEHYAIPDEMYTPEDRMVAKQLKEDYEKALGAMSEKQRTVFLLSRAEGCTYKEISERIGVSVKAVEKRMKMALEYISKALNHKR